MRMIKMMKLAKGTITLISLLLLSLVIGRGAAADSSTDELQRKIADIALLNQQLGDRMRQAEAALEAVLKQQNSLADEVHLLIKSFKIKSFEDTRSNLRLGNDLELLRTIDAYRRAF
jgi:cell division protein FtsB